MTRHDDEERLTLLLRQGARKAEKLYAAVPGRFVAGEERMIALREAREAGVRVSFQGGWSEAERVQVCFHPEDVEPVFTALWVEARWNERFATVEHRALLGSLMALGIDRSFLGDLAVEEGVAYLTALPEVVARLPQEWREAGRTPIKARVLEEPPVVHPPEGLQMRDTVASLRLDCVLASGIRQSRAKAAEMIRAGLVMVNHLPEERVDRALETGDLLSVRGFGRIRLKEVGAPTRKERLPVELEVFCRQA